MADKGNGSSHAGRSSTDPEGEERSWAKVAQGTSRQPRWTAHKILPEEIEDLQRYFTKVLELPEQKLMAYRKEWEGRSVFVRSLGRKVSSEWVAKEFNASPQPAVRPGVICFGGGSSSDSISVKGEV